VKKIHTIDLDESKLEPTSQFIESDYITPSDENSNKLNINHDDKKANLLDSHSEKTPNYSFSTTVQAPLILNQTNDNNQSNKPYADIHLSINIFLPKKIKQNSVSQIQTKDSF
jgi:DNA-binding GntR family transcriptional regulator